MSVEYLRKQLGMNEKIVYTERHHWFFVVSEMIKWIIAGLAMLAALILLQTTLLEGRGWLWWGYLLLLVPVARIGWSILSWRLNVYVITNRRVAEVTGVINKTSSDSSLEKLNDVIVRQSLLGRMLGYGSVEILTASDSGVNDLRQIRRPLEFKTAMVNAKEELEREFGGSG